MAGADSVGRYHLTTAGYYRIASYTLRVRVRIANREFKDYVQRYGLPNTSDAMARCDAAGAAVIGLGEGPVEAMPEGRWPGHAVVIIPDVISDGHLMADATISQVNRPNLQIDLPPFVAIVRDAFVKGERPFREELDGCLLTYTALPNDREHEATELWTSKVGIARVADMVMSRL